jgi:hypothetical protein
MERKASGDGGRVKRRAKRRRSVTCRGGEEGSGDEGESGQGVKRRGVRREHVEVRGELEDRRRVESSELERRASVGASAGGCK